MLTDYDRLVEFVPNLEVCEKLPGGSATRYRLRQQGCSQSLYLRLEASAVLDVQEVKGPLGRRELRFAMVESPNLKVLTSCGHSHPPPVATPVLWLQLAKCKLCSSSACPASFAVLVSKLLADH